MDNNSKMKDIIKIISEMKPPYDYKETQKRLDAHFEKQQNIFKDIPNRCDTCKNQKTHICMHCLVVDENQTYLYYKLESDNQNTFKQEYECDWIIKPKVKDGKILLDKNNKDHRYIMEDE